MHASNLQSPLLPTQPAHLEDGLAPELLHTHQAHGVLAGMQGDRCRDLSPAYLALVIAGPQGPRFLLLQSRTVLI